MAVRWGLRGKSAMALLLACLLSLVPAAILGWQAVDGIRHHFATAYAENYTLLHMQRILAPVSRELALAQRFADSQATRAWLADEDDPLKRRRFFTEAEGFRRSFADHTFFIVVDASGDYYFDTPGETDPRTPRYRIDPDDPEDAWYVETLKSGVPYNINVDINNRLGVTKVWINVVIRDGERTLGIAGSGLDLSGFLDDFIRDGANGMTPMIVAPDGAFQAYSDTQRIAFNSGAEASGSVAQGQRIQSLITDPGQRRALSDAIQYAEGHPGEVRTLEARLEGQPRLLSVGYIPELDWVMITALDVQAARILDPGWLWALLGGLTLLLALLLAGFTYAIERLILGPLRRLQHSARAIADGDYSPQLAVRRDDEIGELSRAFSRMAEQVERHTRELESRVRERTHELEQANREMARARRQIDDSLEYAGIIQRAILPDHRLATDLEHQYAVLWRPRDHVGGDFYLCRESERGCLIGVVDCAGHGVPGALMTMLARAIIDHAILEAGEADPAGILNATDRQTRETFNQACLPASIATNMDIGLVWIDAARATLTFAGAKMSLYASDGEQLEIQRGGKRAIAQKRRMTYTNAHQPLHPGWTYTLCSDGFLDQAGGEHGFGFGNQRFEAMLQARARDPLEAQIAAFEAELEAYRGDLPQRDDITVLSFRYRPSSDDDRDPRDPPQDESP
ncbi:MULTISPECIES: biofilm regulation protein phosphatase SiaA [unclassified Modicisalibacter]|uniref:biofilm regulation protein phosphatase SiaA n=1 Tax=unclassified Modicisalibacter TaxID=2679913 RepID=UPI001CCA0E0B|nr:MULTISPECIES: biofilm regulation protein phosphatase SiaA [unclassified Modicisalibacter]MBZ9560039.1 biofilm regulation protein phosphatase SiaA [Modicisalibacter sp. R2A 31.J]MBZ9575948.1 biofilm regulation protein phosphatase SiaA [Modicisalibacter sp. MOD 31.J]